MDWRSLLTIADAIEFRKSIGGEERIMQYNHSLAVQGGRKLRKLFGTSILENANLGQGELTAAMVSGQASQSRFGGADRRSTWYCPTLARAKTWTSGSNSTSTSKTRCSMRKSSLLS